MDGELQLGLMPTVPFVTAVGSIRRAYYAHYLGVAFDDDRASEYDRVIVDSWDDKDLIL